jgi:hypothetical protein
LAFCLWHFLKYVKTGSKWSLLFTILGIVFAFVVRTYLGAALAVAVFAYFLVFAAPKDKLRRVIYFMILIIISSPFFYVGYRVAKSQLATNVVRIKEESGREVGTGVEDVRVFSPTRLATNLMRIFFSPIPWRDLRDAWENVLYWTYPGKWLWYIFMPFFFVGAYYGLRHKFREVFVPAGVIFQYIVILTIIMQTAHRHQMPIMPLMILTAAGGFCKTRNPILAYLIYLPLLAVFFLFDNDILEGGLVFLAVLAAGYFVYVYGLVRKKVRGQMAESG